MVVSHTHIKNTIKVIIVTIILLVVVVIGIVDTVALMRVQLESDRKKKTRDTIYYTHHIIIAYSSGSAKDAF
jgi:hypothetical protein